MIKYSYIFIILAFIKSVFAKRIKIKYFKSFDEAEPEADEGNQRHSENFNFLQLMKKNIVPKENKEVQTFIYPESPNQSMKNTGLKIVTILAEDNPKVSIKTSFKLKEPNKSNIEFKSFNQEASDIEKLDDTESFEKGEQKPTSVESEIEKPRDYPFSVVKSPKEPRIEENLQGKTVTVQEIKKEDFASEQNNKGKTVADNKSDQIKREKSNDIPQRDVVKDIKGYINTNGIPNEISLGNGNNKIFLQIKQLDEI